MTAPHYVAVKVNDRYEMRRADPQGKVANSMMTVGGGLLALYGLSRRGVLGTLTALLGGGMMYTGLTGRDPLQLIEQLRHRRHGALRARLCGALSPLFCQLCVQA